MNRIVIMGTEGRKKEIAAQKLGALCRPGGYPFETAESKATRVRQGDYVILAAEFGRERGDELLTPWQELTRLTGLLEELADCGPRAVLLLSDVSVYGKLFGDVRLLKEQEMGYVCHTDPKDAAAQCMRMMEHLSLRLARTEGLPLKVARLDTGDFPAEQILRVLEKGVSGEVYNVSGRSGEEGRQERRSPLSPVPVLTDTGKAGLL